MSDTYQLTHDAYVIRNGTDKVPTNLPWCEANAEYQEYAAWLAAGGTPSPADPLSVVVPVSVTARQAEQALILAGLIDLVEPAIDAIPDPTQRAMVRSEWRRSQVFERNRPSLIALGSALGLNAAALDALFVKAATL